MRIVSEFSRQPCGYKHEINGLQAIRDKPVVSKFREREKKSNRPTGWHDTCMLAAGTVGLGCAASSVGLPFEILCRSSTFDTAQQSPLCHTHTVGGYMGFLLGWALVKHRELWRSCRAIRKNTPRKRLRALPSQRISDFGGSADVRLFRHPGFVGRPGGATMVRFADICVACCYIWCPQCRDQASFLKLEPTPQPAPP